MIEPIRTFTEFEEFLGRFTNYERMQFVRYDKHTFGIERMRSFAAELGNPHEAYLSVHIAGTKGKGSTSLMLESLLRAEGYKVGTYLSPHVERLTERIRIDGSPVPEADMVGELNCFLDVLSRRQAAGPSEFPSFFELMTALGMSICRRQAIDWGIFEVGLGGRLDATNILRPRIAAITNIGLEHTQQLGNSLSEIAREKAGIVKPGVPLVLGRLYPEAAREILRIALERGAPVIPFEERAVERNGALTLRVAEVDGTIEAGCVVGPALRDNLAVALVILRQILAADGKSPRPERISAALQRLELPARIEFFPGSPPLVLDAAHTVESVRSLGASLEEIGLPRPRTMVFSIARGKQLEAILDELPRIAEELLWTYADPVRSVPPDSLRRLAGRGEVIESPEQALEEAMRRGNPVVVTGSFYLAGRLRQRLRVSLL